MLPSCCALNRWKSLSAGITPIWKQSCREDKHTEARIDVAVCCHSPWALCHSLAVFVGLQQHERPAGEQFVSHLRHHGPSWVGRRPCIGCSRPRSCTHTESVYLKSAGSLVGPPVQRRLKGCTITGS